MQSKGDICSGDTSHSPFLICAKLCTDGLRLYAKQAPDEGRFSLPIVVVCVVLGDVTQIAVYVATSGGSYRLGEGVQNQDIIAIGECICTALWHNLMLAQPLSSPREQILPIRRSARGWGSRGSMHASRPSACPFTTSYHSRPTTPALRNREGDVWIRAGLRCLRRRVHQYLLLRERLTRAHCPTSRAQTPTSVRSCAWMPTLIGHRGRRPGADRFLQDIPSMHPYLPSILCS